MTTYNKLFFVKMWLNYHVNPFFLYKQYLGKRIANKIIEKTGRHSTDIIYCFKHSGFFLSYDIISNEFYINYQWYKF